MAPCVNGPDGSAQALLARPDQFVQTLTEKLMTYALGRAMEYMDMPFVRAIVRDSAADDYRFRTLVTEHRHQRRISDAAFRLPN